MYQHITIFETCTAVIDRKSTELDLLIHILLDLYYDLQACIPGPLATEDMTRIDKAKYLFNPLTHG